MAKGIATSVARKHRARLISRLRRSHDPRGRIEHLAWGRNLAVIALLRVVWASRISDAAAPARGSSLDVDGASVTEIVHLALGDGRALTRERVMMRLLPDDLTAFVQRGPDGGLDGGSEEGCGKALDRYSCQI